MPSMPSWLMPSMFMPSWFIVSCRSLSMVTSSATSPATSNTRFRVMVSPCTNGAVSPIIITWYPPRCKSTSPLAGTTKPSSTSIILATPSVMIWVCSSTRLAASVVAEIRRSASAPVLVITIKAAPTRAAGEDARAYGSLKLISAKAGKVERLSAAPRRIDFKVIIVSIR